MVVAATLKRGTASVTMFENNQLAVERLVVEMFLYRYKAQTKIFNRNSSQKIFESLVGYAQSAGPHGHWSGS